MLANRTRWLLLAHFGTHSDLPSYPLLGRIAEFERMLLAHKFAAFTAGSISQVGCQLTVGSKSGVVHPNGCKVAVLLITGRHAGRTIAIRVVATALPICDGHSLVVAVLRCTSVSHKRKAWADEAQVFPIVRHRLRTSKFTYFRVYFTNRSG